MNELTVFKNQEKCNRSLYNITEPTKVLKHLYAINQPRAIEMCLMLLLQIYTQGLPW